MPPIRLDVRNIVTENYYVLLTVQGTEEVTDAVLQGRVALVVFKNAIAAFPGES